MQTLNKHIGGALWRSDLAHAQAFPMEMPHDDQSRLALAEELGGERGQFIRLQVARAASDRGKRRARRSHESPQEEHLLSLCGKLWAEEIGPFVRIPADYRGLSFHRGFVARADIKNMAEANTAFERAPIEVLAAEAEEFDYISLLQAPWLDRVRALIVTTRAGDPLALAISQCPRLRNLRYLGLPHNRFGPAGIEALVASPHLVDIPRVDLTGNRPNPVERPVYDEVGSVVSVDREPFGVELQARYGDRAWLHCAWDRRDDEPDVWMERL